MPRVDNNRGISIPYRPGNIVNPNATQQEQMRAVWDELNRIAIATAAIDQPVSAGVQVTGDIPVGSVVDWQRIFNAGFVGDPWTNPADSFDVTTGIYTVPTEGVYSVQVLLTVDAFATPQTKDYYAGIRATITPVGGAPVELFSYSGGPDTVPVSVSTLLTQDFKQGGQVYFDATAVHEQVTGVTAARATLQIFRISGTGDNTA